MLVYTGPHTRGAANGSQKKFTIVGGKDIADLRYGAKIKIVLDGKAYDAVVDVMVATVWGGPAAAFRFYDLYLALWHVMRKIVYQTDDGGWNEFRDLVEATEEEFLKWRSEFNGATPPTPMP